jgi:integrase
LAREPGYRSKISYTDADYFSLSDKDVAVARARRDKPVPTIAQVEHVLSMMPNDTVVQRRDRALIAFTMLTGARVGALASFRRGDVNAAGGYVDHDARHVQSKFAKTFRTHFMPVSDRASAIVRDWHAELSADVARGQDDPLFPATAVAPDDQGSFVATGLLQSGWSGTGPVRDVFRRAFGLAGLAYFNPHSFRDMLVRHAMTLDLTPEAMKAWSQNLGHADVLTTFTSYGQVPLHRQGELIRATALSDAPYVATDQIEVLEALVATIRAGRVPGLPANPVDRLV